MQLSVFLIALGVAAVTYASKESNSTKLKDAKGPETADGLTYLGVGYDLLIGNPEGGALSKGGVDPGLLSSKKILQLTWNEGKITSDRKFKVPDQVSFAHHSSCIKTTTHEMFSGAKSYQEKLAKVVTDEIGASSETTGIWNAAFSLSTRYDDMEKETTAKKNVFFENKKVCNSGRARFQLDLARVKKSPVTEEFAVAACKLPKTYNKDDYFKFIKQWGTNVVMEVELGTVETERFESSYVQIANYATENLGLEMSASGGYLMLKGALSAVFDSFKEASSDKAQLSSHSVSFCSGGADLPAPIGLKLLSIDEVFSNSFFRGLKKRYRCGNLQLRRNNVRRVLKNYPKIRGAPKPHDPDMRIPVEWPQGAYGLPMPNSGCPRGDFWHEGQRWHDTENLLPSNEWSHPYDLKGYKDPSGMLQRFCMKTLAKTSEYSLPWPKGSYCIYQKGWSCPEPGFESAYVFWLDEKSKNENNVKGELPDGIYDKYALTRIDFCCRKDGFTANAIILPTESPFVLIKASGSDPCQNVKGMQVRKEWFQWDMDESSTNNMILHRLGGETTKLIDGEVGAQLVGAHSNLRIYYCYYYHEKEGN